MWSNEPALHPIHAIRSQTVSRDECRWVSCPRMREAGSLYCPAHGEMVRDERDDARAEQ